MLFQHYLTTLYQLYLSYTVDPADNALFSELCGLFPALKRQRVGPVPLLQPGVLIFSSCHGELQDGMRF
jgi:hypothetical protein